MLGMKVAGLLKKFGITPTHVFLFSFFCIMSLTVPEVDSFLSHFEDLQNMFIDIYFQQMLTTSP